MFVKGFGVLEVASLKNNKTNIRIFAGIILCSAILFALMNLYTKNNSFPLIFHPDEPSKVEIILLNEHKFYHPLLLLVFPKIIANTIDITSPQKVAEIGRFFSAMFASLSIAVFMVFVFIHRGIIAGAAAGLIAGLCPMLLVHAHYFKEDTAMLFGLSAVFLTLAMYIKNVDARNLILLGISCALAASGKYIGAVILPIALPVVFSKRLAESNLSNKTKVKWFFIGFLATLLIINYPIFYNINVFFKGLSHENTHVMRSHGGLSVQRFGTFYINTFLDETPMLIRVFALIYFVLLIIDWKKREKSEKIFALFPFFYYIIISSSPVQLTRYLLPVIVWTYVLAAVGMYDMFKFWLACGSRTCCAASPPALKAFNNSLKVLVGILMLASLANYLYMKCGNYLSQFENDSRFTLEEWASNNLPKNAKIALDTYAALHLDKKTNSPKTGTKDIYFPAKFIGELKSIDEARKKGFQYIITCDLAYQRFFEPNTFPEKRKFAPTSRRYNRDLNKYKTFYLELFAKGKLVWHYKPAMPINAFTNPEIRVYQISDNPASDSLKIKNN